MAATLDDLLAQNAIRTLQMRYCRACDRMDFALLESCFHPDAVFDYRGFKGGLEAFIAMAREGLKGYLRTTHNTGNQLVEVSGDTAWAEHYTVATHRLAATEGLPERDYVAAIRYIDRAERRDGEWRIARRDLVLDWWRTDPLAPGMAGSNTDTTARRDRSDPSYRLL